MSALSVRVSVPGTLASMISERIRRDIASAVFLPGQRLGIAALRERYGVGASPIREALNRLSSEGVVSQADQRGFRVPEIDADDLRDLTLTRCMLNDVALRSAIGRADETSDAAIVVAFHRLRRTLPGFADQDSRLRAEWLEAHAQFHAAIIACCGSRRLLEFDASLAQRAEQYIALSGFRDREPSYDGTPRDIEGEHRCIMEAVLDRDADRAVSLLNAHITATMSIVNDFVSAQSAAAAATAKRVRPAALV